MNPGRPKPPLFFISGISQAVSVALILLISLSLIGIVFAFGNVLLQSQSRQEKISILDATIVKLSSSVIVRFSVGNTGTEQVTLTLITLDGTPCSKTYSQNIPPGQRFSDTFLCNVNLALGAKVVVRAVATTPSGKNVGDAVWATVQE
jgi:hypothetical protein